MDAELDALKKKAGNAPGGYSGVPPHKRPKAGGPSVDKKKRIDDELDRLKRDMGK